MEKTESYVIFICSEYHDNIWFLMGEKKFSPMCRIDGSVK